MKKLTLIAFSALVLSLTCSSVFAVDGTITVKGVVTDQTCTLQGVSWISGVKDITITLPPLPKSSFTPTNPVSVKYGFDLTLKNAAGTGSCDAATTKAFKGIHLSPISATDLDATDKTLLVNKATGAGGASAINPIFIQLFADNGRAIDFSEPWGTQAKSPARIDFNGNAYVYHNVAFTSKTGIVDAQNVHAIVNYTLMYN